MNKNQNEKIITLDVFDNYITANFAKNKLELNDIQVFLEDTNSIGINPLAGIELKIFFKDLKKAFKILSE